MRWLHGKSLWCALLACWAAGCGEADAPSTPGDTNASSPSGSEPPGGNANPDGSDPTVPGPSGSSASDSDPVTGAPAGSDSTPGQTSTPSTSPSTSPVDAPPPPSSGVGVSIVEQCTDPNVVGPTPIRRISSHEYFNAVRDTLGTSVGRGDLPADEKLGAFTANVASPLVQDNFDRYVFLADQVASDVVADFAARSGCTSTADTACTQGYLASVARRLFHGTLDEADAARLNDLYTSLSAETDTDLATRTALSWMLTSPRFLFLVEFGSPNGTMAALTPSEIAGRLAAFLWRSVPDAALLQAADSGMLETPEGVRSQAEAMLLDPRASEVLKLFANQWLRINGPPPQASALEQQISDQVGQFMARATTDPSLSFQDLMQGDLSAAAGAELTSMYGDSPRTGVLLSAGFLASNASGTRPSQIKRGYVVRSSLLCTPIPPPDDPIAMQLPDVMAGQTEGDAFDAHSSEPTCWGCHQLMDPIGRTFNNYGFDGNYDAAAGEDASGTIYGASNGGEVEFAETSELLNYLADDVAAQQCFVLQSARFALGRGETKDDACSVRALADAFEAGQYSVRDLLVQIASSTMFLNRNPVNPQASCR